MIIGGKTWPQDRKWVIAIAAVSLLAAVAYVAEWSAEGRLPGGSSRTGFLYGVVGGLIILFELLLWPRKRVRSWRIGSAQLWLRAHVWLGLLSVPLVVMHARLFFIGGLMNLALMGAFVIVIASGIWGLVLQQFLPWSRFRPRRFTTRSGTWPRSSAPMPKNSSGRCANPFLTVPVPGR